MTSYLGKCSSISSGEYWAKLTENLTCPLCYDLFDDDARLPKGLPCYHTICLGCLQSWLANYSAGYNPNRKNGYLVCPLCQSPFSIPVEGVKAVPTNIGLKNMIELLPRTKTEQGDSSMNDSLHVNGEYGPPKPVCNLHSYKECTFVCMECTTGLCDYCITGLKTGPHHDHTLDQLDWAMAQLQENAENTSEKLARLLGNHKESGEAALNELMSWKQGLKENVSRRARDLVQKAHKWQTTVEKHIEEHYEEAYQDINKLMYKSADIVSELQPQLKELGKMCKRYDLDSYNKMAAVKRKLSDLDYNMEGHSLAKIPHLRLNISTFPIDVGMLTTKKDSMKMYLIINDVALFRKSDNQNPISSQIWSLQKLPWRLEVCKAKESENALSAFLYCDANKYVTKEWSCSVKFKVTVLSHTDKAAVSLETSHNYCPRSTNWGWPEFMTWSSLMDPGRGFINNNCITVEATVSVLE